MGRSAEGTRALILGSARQRLLADGYAGLSTRKVADAAGVPLSQLHYHFGSKQGLILTLLQEEDRRRLERQTHMYEEEAAPLWQRYEIACDYLEDDLDSGYVRTLQEMIAAGWSNPEIGDAARKLLRGWFDLVTGVAREAETRLGGLGPFTAQEVGTLTGCLFMGAESMLLLGFDRQDLPIRSALRRISALIRTREEASAAEGRTL